MDGAFVALKGYKFQFDKTILEIFDKPDKTVSVEQIQDYGFDDYCVQVKYHNTDYTLPQQKAKQKKPILQLIDQFKTDKSKKYILYIFLKGVRPLKKELRSVDELEEIIGKKTKYNITDKSEFIKNFTIIFANDFECQYADLIQKIKNNYSKSIEEAEIYYSVISGYLLDIIIKNPPSNITKRITSKIEIDNLIQNGKKIIFKSAYVEILGKDKYFKHLNKLYFNKSLNTEPNERFFIIEIDKSISTHLLKEVVIELKNKWSRNKTRTIPNTDRFAPYIFFKGLPDYDLVILKKNLQIDGHIIKDGFDFFNAEFNLQSIKEKPTFENKIFFKLVNSKDHLDDLLINISATKEVYQFYYEEPLSFSIEAKQVKIQIQDINDIKNIL